jgi:hypothetical protein
LNLVGICLLEHNWMIWLPPPSASSIFYWVEKDLPNKYLEECADNFLRMGGAVLKKGYAQRE